jgi:hypothetical protein
MSFGMSASKGTPFAAAAVDDLDLRWRISTARLARPSPDIAVLCHSPSARDLARMLPSYLL